MSAPALRIIPAFLPAVAAADLFAQLQREVDWDQRMKARKTASFGAAYDCSQITYPEAPMPAAIDAVCAALARELGFRPNNCLLNYYEDGLSSMGFHSDTSEELAPDTGVAIVSLGGMRDIVYRNKADRGIEHRYAMTSGSLLYMDQAIQDDWLHAIPKQEAAEPRISMTFRSIVK